MSQKSPQIAARIAPFQGKERDAHYLGFFDCLNRQLFFEAHEVLEELWLADRRGPDGDFLKGLIQLAGAFVHIQKGRPGPAAALFRLTRANLEKYPSRHWGLDVRATLGFVDDWCRRLETSPETQSLLAAGSGPVLALPT